MKNNIFLNFKIHILLFILLISLVVFGCSSNKITMPKSSSFDSLESVTENEYVVIPLSDLSEDANFYAYDVNGVEVRYFAVLGSDGKPRVAFDACDVCGGHQGYEQNNGDITCRKCGRVFSIDGLGEKNKGYGCWPSHLEHEVMGSNVKIKIANLVHGRGRFE